MRFRSFRRPLAIVALAVLLPACGPSTPTQSGPPPGGGGGVMAASISATPSNTFSPSEVNLLVGGSVTFSNSGGLHNVSSGDFRCAVGCDGQGGNGDPSNAAWSFTTTFPTAGTVGFVCDEHAGVGMNGRIIVQ